MLFSISGKINTDYRQPGVFAIMMMMMVINCKVSSFLKNSLTLILILYGDGVGGIGGCGVSLSAESASRGRPPVMDHMIALLLLLLHKMHNAMLVCAGSCTI